MTTGGPNSVYEQWVVGLRTWSTDPRTDLRGLPPIDEMSFPPTTYQRFLMHLNQAINRFMGLWSEQLSVATAAARTPHDLGRALVDARRGLAARLALARHSSFPPTIRTSLVEQAEQDIRNIQQQLEERAARSGTEASSIDRTATEAMLRVVRSNALTAVLDPNFDPESAIAGATAGPPPPMAAPAAPAASVGPEPGPDGPSAVRRPARRVVVTPSED